MRLAGRAQLLAVLVVDDDAWHHEPLCTKIAQRARSAGLASIGVRPGRMT
jgi:hypothetical protein